MLGRIGCKAIILLFISHHNEHQISQRRHAVSHLATNLFRSFFQMQPKFFTTLTRNIFSTQKTKPSENIFKGSLSTSLSSRTQHSQKHVVLQDSRGLNSRDVIKKNSAEILHQLLVSRFFALSNNPPYWSLQPSLDP